MRIHNSNGDYWVVGLEVSESKPPSVPTAKATSKKPLTTGEAVVKSIFNATYILVPTGVLVLVDPSSAAIGAAVWICALVGWIVFLAVAMLCLMTVTALSFHRQFKAIEDSSPPAERHYLKRGLLGKFTDEVRRGKLRGASDDDVWKLYNRHAHVVDGFLTDAHILEMYAVTTSPANTWTNQAQAVAHDALAVAARAFAARLDEFEQAHIARGAQAELEAQQEYELRAEGEVEALQGAADHIRDVFA